MAASVIFVIGRFAHAREPLGRDKVARAGRLGGPKLFVSLSSCPPGWGIDPEESVEVARLAVESGVWPLKEWQGEAVVHTVVPHKRKPVEEYLCCQARYRHLFEPERRDEALRQIQSEVDRYWTGIEGFAPRPERGGVPAARGFPYG